MTDIKERKIVTDNCGYIRDHFNRYEHRVIVENILGYKLPPYAIIHHVDYIKTNNQLINLVVCPDQKYHMLLHKRTNIILAGGNPDTDSWCSGCKRIHPNNRFSTTKKGLHPVCREYNNWYRGYIGLNKNKFNWRESLNQQYRRAFRKSGIICKI